MTSSFHEMYFFVLLSNKMKCNNNFTPEIMIYSADKDASEPLL